MLKTFRLCILALLLCLPLSASAGGDGRQGGATLVGLSVSPSFQRNWFGVDDGQAVYNSIGGTVRLNFDIMETLSRAGHLRLALGASLRAPLSFGASDSRRPDVFGFFEFGYAFHAGEVMRLVPFFDLGFGMCRFGKGTLGAAGVELGWLVSRKVQLFLSPRFFYSPGVYFGQRNQFAPSVDAGVSFVF